MASFVIHVTVLCFVNLILETTDGLAVPSPRACVIGAGYGGLASARYLKEYGVDFTVFEAQKSIGGNWRWQTDLEEDGLPPFTGIYKQLRTNTPRQTMEFAKFSFPDTTPSYPTGPCFNKYLTNFTKEFGLEKYIQFRSLVTSVKWADNKWEISHMKTDSKENSTTTCDFVIVSIGHYNQPKIPKFEGQDGFNGNIIHVQKYKDPEEFRNRKILLVGAGPSGLDLATHLTNVSAKLVHSHHLRYNQPHFGKNYIKKPDIKMFTSSGVVFQDDSFEEIEDVIFCTGYDFDFSFLHESCGLTVSSKFVLPLYQHMVNIRRPSMVLLALPKPIITRALDAQADYAASLAAGKFELPSQEDMLKSWLQHVYSLQTRGKKIVDVNFLADQQDQYFANLTAEAGITRVPPVLTVMRDFNAVNRLEDLLNYRDYDYEILDDNNYKRFYNPRNETCNIIHVQKYKDPEEFRNRKILLVGAGPSGLDLATHLTNVSAKLVHSHHLRYNQPHFGKNYIKKPDIKMFTSSGVVFQDVIFCTGYDFDFSFLHESCGLTGSSKFVLPLYQHMVNIGRPSMVLLALPKPIITRALDAQADYAASLAAGKFELPSQEDMLKSWLQHVYSLQTRGKKIVDVNFLADQQDQYFANLTAEAGITRVPPVLTVMRDFNAVNRLEDLLNYRDYDYEILDDNNYKRFYNPRNETCNIVV